MCDFQCATALAHPSRHCQNSAHQRLQPRHNSCCRLHLIIGAAYCNFASRMGNDQEQQDEELEALEAIYGEDVEIDREARSVQIYIPSRHHVPHVIMQALLVDGYPSQHPPVLQLSAVHLSDSVTSRAVATMEGMFAKGGVVLYSWAEWLKEEGRHMYELATHPSNGRQAEIHRSGGVPREEHDDEDDDDAWQPGSEDYDDDDGDEDDSEGDLSGYHEHGDAGAGREGTQVDASWQRRANKAAAPCTHSLLDSVRPKIVSGEPYTERKSTFQAHMARVHSPEEATAVVEVLLENNKIRNATHNIMAYRITCEGRGTFHQDCDDDGEDAAGGRLLHLLQVSDAKDIVVVVSRWFGGVLLGPSRFTLINNTARQLLEAQAIIAAGSKAGRTAAGARAASKGAKPKHK